MYIQLVLKKNASAIPNDRAICLTGGCVEALLWALSLYTCRQRFAEELVIIYIIQDENPFPIFSSCSLFSTS